MSILIAKHIKNVLKGVSSKISGGIFLEGVNRETECPYIVYSYSVSPDEETKDGDFDSCDVNIKIYSKDGDSSIEIANEVRKLMKQTAEYDEFCVESSAFVSYQGEWNGDDYLRELNFNIKTESYG